MYAASQAFHDAVRNGNRQMPLLIFKDAVFTEKDIDVDAGIEFDDNFNMEEDLAIGQATSNEIRFTLINDDRLLNDYEFGEFIATLGVMIDTGTYSQTGDVSITTSNATYVGNHTSPYLTRNGSAVSRQPAFAVKSLLGYGGKVWAFGSNGEYAVYNDATGGNITSQNPVNAFMQNKSKAWFGMGFAMNGRILTISMNGESETYEFVPLGVFDGERPNAPDQIRIAMTCYDRMVRFDKDMPSDADLQISYPLTISQLFVKLCNYIDVPYESSTFINSTATIAKRPEAFDSATMRAVIGWIAEAGCSNARFDRDGNLKLDWLKLTGQSMDEHDYMEFTPYWYETERIGKVCNRKTADGSDLTVGEGVGYLIQDNPLLDGAE